MERIDNDITYILNKAQKKVEDPRHGVPYSKEKVKQRAALLYWKTKKKEIR